MTFISNPEDNTLEHTEEFSRTIGCQYFPEELHAPAFELAISLGEIALSVHGTEAAHYGDTSEETAVYNRLADAALDSARVVVRFIPPTSLLKLEREHRRQNIRGVSRQESHPHTERTGAGREAEEHSSQDRPALRSNILQRAARRKFWQGVEIEEPKRRRNQVPEWGLATLEHFMHRPLTTTDLAKVLFGNRFANSPINELQINVNNSVLKSEKIKEALEERGLELKSVKSSREKIYVCKEIGVEFEVDWTARPTDDELRTLAIQLRQAGLAKQIKDQTEKTWMAKEADEQRFSNRWSARIARELHKIEMQDAVKERKAEAQARREIREWEALRLQQDKAWADHKTELHRRAEQQQKVTNKALDKVDTEFRKEERVLKLQSKKEVKAWKRDELKQELEEYRSQQRKLTPSKAKKGVPEAAALKKIRVQQPRSMSRNGRRELDENGFPPGFIVRIEALEEKLRHPPSHDEIIRILRESGFWSKATDDTVVM